jgi:holo-[acyl-carrier protein] synthase
MEKRPAYGIGVDIEGIARFRKLDRKRHSAFFSKVFTHKELDYCFSKPDAAQHLAARFAGKEAVIKALSGLGKKHPGHAKIEIARRKDGAPSVRLPLKGVRVAISLSHARDAAIAFAVATRNK